MKELLKQQYEHDSRSCLKHDAKSTSRSRALSSDVGQGTNASFGSWKTSLSLGRVGGC